jgi:YD repeat-containing protein
MPVDRSLETLLLLDGERFFVDDSGFFVVEFKVKKVRATPEKPHGLDYSLVLIGPGGERLVGYDNAHPVRRSRGPAGKGQGQRDHRHAGERVRRYEYTDAGQLLADFWGDVDKALKQRGVKP